MTEVERMIRSAVSKTAWRWRKRMKVKQLEIEGLEESVKRLRDDLERQRLALIYKDSELMKFKRDAMLETRFTTAKDIAPNAVDEFYRRFGG